MTQSNTTAVWIARAAGRCHRIMAWLYHPRLCWGVLLGVLLWCPSGGCGAFVSVLAGAPLLPAAQSAAVTSLNLSHRAASAWKSMTRPASCLCCRDGGLLEDEGLSHEPPSKRPSHIPESYRTERGERINPPQLSRRTLLENAGRSAAAAVAAFPAAVAGGWMLGSREGVQPAAAFGGPSRPLSRCLTIAVNAREFSKRLEADLAAGQKAQECRGMVKSVLRGLSLQECLKDAVLYLPSGRRQAASDAGQSAVEYLATVVEFDAWDKLDKDWTSNVALRNMTPDNVQFVRMALDAAGGSLDVFLSKFDKADVDYAKELYVAYFRPVEE